MKDLNDNMYQRLEYEQSYGNQEESPCNGTENVSIVVRKKKVKNRKKNESSKCGQHPAVKFKLSPSKTLVNCKLIKKHSSLPEINSRPKFLKQRTKSSNVIPWGKKHFPNIKLIVNKVSEYHFNNNVSPFNNPSRKKFKVYRCQLSTLEESCCCSCNSDAMFEVMKSLYDCYKKKNCDDCNCILCGHLPREERRLGKIRKSLLDIGLAGTAKERKEKVKQAAKQLEGKSDAEKELILKELAKTGQPLPKGKTASEKELIRKVRSELGLPPEPKTATEKERMKKAEKAGLVTPLEGKSAAQKEKILKAQQKLGIELPEGRTESERALVRKIKSEAGVSKGVATEKMRKTKEAGVITPIEGKPPEQQEKILRGLAMQGMPLPEAKTASEKRLIDKVRADLGLPPDAKTSSMKAKHAKAAEAGLLQPLEGKTNKEKEKILKGLQERGIPLPEGRTASEKALIAKVKARAPEKIAGVPSEKIRKAKEAGLLTPLEGKPPDQQEKILRGLAMQGIPLPEAKTASEKRLVDKVRADLGLPPDAKTSSMKAKHAKAAEAGLLQPLEGKTNKEKEKILKGLQERGIPLPEGRTASEKALIAKVKARAPEKIAGIPSEKIRKTKEAGVITPIEGKPPDQQEKILRGLAMQGMPLPEAKTASEKRLIDKVRADLGLPPDAKTSSMKAKHAKAAEAGLLQPLEGKTNKEKEKILKGLQERGIPLPEGRTASEKALIAKVKARAPEKIAGVPSEKIRKAKEAGLLTPLEGKTPDQQEKILRGLAMQGIPLPEAKTASEKRLVDKVRADLGLPPDAKTSSMKAKHAKAAEAGLLQPLEGKTNKEKEKILKGLQERGIQLPEGRTTSEKAIIAKVKARAPEPVAAAPSEKIRKAKEAGLLTPLEGKTPDQKEKIIKGIAMQGLPLPEGKTASERKMIDKVRKDLGLPPEAKNKAMKDKHKKAAEAGLLQPLEGKTTKEKEKILQGLHEMGIPLPEGRTKSEKALIAKIKTRAPEPIAPVPSEKARKAKEKAAPTVAVTPSEKLRKAKAAGLVTPLEGKAPEQREKILRGLGMQGIPLPEAKTASEKRLIEKVRADLGLPPEPQSSAMRGKYAKAADAGILQPLEGKSHKEKEKILQGLHDMGIPLPVGRTASEKALIAKIQTEPKAPSEKLRKAKAAGLVTPLAGKSAAQREKILRGLAMQGVPLPEAKTPSEKMLIDKVRADLGLPPDPKNTSMRDKYAKAADAGLMMPLEGKSHKEKERILKGLRDMGIPLPEGRTASEKALITKILTPSAAPSAAAAAAPTEKLRKAKAAGLLTPLEGKSAAQKEKILRGLAMQGLPLPEVKTSSDRKLLDKVRADVGLPPEPKTPSMKEKYEQAAAAGLLQPLEGKSDQEKEKILQGLQKMGVPLPEGRTKSEKALISKVKGGPRPSVKLIPSEKLRKAQAAGLITPLEGKSPEQREKILRGLVMQGVPLPEGKSASEKILIDKVRADVGLPPPPRTASEKEKYNKAVAAGIMTPLEGKSAAEKEKILRAQQNLGIALPKGRTASEKDLINKIKRERPRTRTVSVGAPPLPPDKRRKLDEKTAKVIKEGSGPVDECICGLLTPESEREAPPAYIPPPVEKRKVAPTPSITTAKIRKAKEAGLLTPLEGKSAEQKEKILKGLAATGIPLPEGKTVSEKALIKKVKADMGVREPTPSEKVRKAKLAGVLTPLEGKPISQKEKILRGRAAAGLPLPVGKTPSEKALIHKIKKDTGYVTPSPSERMKRAKAAGLLTPLEGKTTAQKEKILRDRLAAGVPIPEGKTPSEKDIIRKITAEAPPSVKPSERLRKAKATGVLTPLEGKSPKEKERIIRGLVKARVPLPEPKTASEKNLMDKVRRDVGLPREPSTPSLKEKLRKAQEAGIITPLEGKSKPEKEKVLRRLHEAGLPLPEGRTASEKSMVKRIKAEAPERKTPSEKIKAAKAAGLLTPLEGKSTAQKEQILKSLADAGVPLPEAKTASEKAIIAKIKTERKERPEKRPSERLKPTKEVEFIHKPMTPVERRKLDQKTAKVMKEGKGPSDECICGLLTPETEIGEPPKAPSKIPSEKIRKAKAAGILTPLEGKSSADKEKILRGQAKAGIPLPEAKTTSDRKLTNKIRKELGLPPEPKTASMKERHDKAAAAGLLQPLEGLSPAEKVRVLKGQADLGLELPEGRTASEKELIAKIKAETKLPPSRIPSDKVAKAKAAGLLTPLKGKKAADKEKIMRGLAKEGLPLPDKTSSERKIANKIRKELGLPPEPKTSDMKEKYKEAATAGILVPLEGLSPPEKEKLLRAQAKMGIPLPEARTASEKALIAKIKAEGEPSLRTAKKLKKAKAAGLLTPLEGKSHKEKERIVEKLADAGLPLPEGKTASEKALIQKVRAERGEPPPAKTASEKAIVQKAKRDGLLTPIAGKSAKEKERIIKGLADAGLPMPEGKTTSEKELIKKIRTEAGLPPEPTPSEKRGEIKTKSKRVGATASKKLKARGIGEGGIAEEFEDVLKTTTCDRGCGCDKKKIRFKHSYVKIRVTSPDISSLCPCPNECIPGVKAGAFIDNEGIKVTVGRVNGATSYTSQYSIHLVESSKHIITLYDKLLSNRYSSNTSIDSLDASPNNNIVSNDLQQTTDTATPSQRCLDKNSKMNHGQLYSSTSYSSDSYDSPSSYRTYEIKSARDSTDKWIDSSGRFRDATGYLEALGEIYRRPMLMSYSSDDTATELSSRGSFDSIIVIRSESSLSLTTSASSVDVISVISFSSCSTDSNSTHYLYCPVLGGNFSDSTVEELECFTNKIDYSEGDTLTSNSNSLITKGRRDETRTKKSGNNEAIAARQRRHNEYLTFRMSQMELGYDKMRTRVTNTGDPVIVINDLNSEHDITTMVDQLLSKNEFSDASSIFVVVPTSDDNDSDDSEETVNSTICIQVSEQVKHWSRNPSCTGERATTPKRSISATRGLRISSKGKKYFMDGMQKNVASFQHNETITESPEGYEYVSTKQRSTINKPRRRELLVNRYQVASTDTTSDRPCCCAPEVKQAAVQNHSSDDGCAASVVSEVLTPLLVTQGLDSDQYRQLRNLSVSQETSYIAANLPPTPVEACQIPPCSGHVSCHDPPRPPPRRDISEPCRCSPEKLRELLAEAVKAGKSMNMKSTGCGGGPPKPIQVTIAPPPPPPPPLPPPPPPPPPTPYKPNQPIITESDEDCPSCSKHKYKDGATIKCTCSGKKKIIKLRALCPCEQYQPPVSNTVTGPRPGTRSFGAQFCTCDDPPCETCPKKFFGILNKKGAGKQSSRMGYIDVCGPDGGSVLMEQGGTYTQAGRRDLPANSSATMKSSSSSKNKCVCRNKRKKKKNVVCECSPPSLGLEQDVVAMISQPSPLDFSYDELIKYQKYEQKQALKQKSDMTQTQSGFSVLKKKKPPPPPETEFTVEDAVRYYATLNPDLLKELCPPPSGFDEADDCDCEDKKKKSKVDCECPYEPPPPPPPEPAKEEEGPFRGFKFSIGGKGSGSKGLGGVCCFDMIEELYISKQRSKER